MSDENNNDEFSFVDMAQIACKYVGENGGDHCGYCKAENAERVTHGIVTRDLTPTCYEHLMNRGWRRCGTYTYKPVMNRICCPQYAIRCDTHNLHVTRTQRRVARHMTEYLQSGKMPPMKELKATQKTRRKKKRDTGETSNTNDDGVSPSGIQQQTFVCRVFDENNLRWHEKERSDNVAALRSELLSERQKGRAKVKRAMRAIERWKKQGLNPDEMYMKSRQKRMDKRTPLTVEQLLTKHEATKETNKHTLKFTIVRVGRLLENSVELRREHAVYSKYQQAIHGDEPYECDMGQFKRFLCTPMADEQHPDVRFYMGSIHLRTHIDERIVGVSVIDITPTAISSVYYFYDPEYAPLTLGTHGGLVEAAYARFLSQLRPAQNTMRWLYLGYYVHSCVKMRYKARFRPSYLLCPEVYTWHDYDKCKAKLDMNKYSRFEEDTSIVDTQGGALEQVQVLNPLLRKVTSYMELRTMMNLGDEITAEVREYAHLVGKNALPMLALIL